MEETLKVVTPQMRLAYLNRLANDPVVSCSNGDNVAATVIITVGFAILVGVALYYEHRIHKLKTAES